MACSRKLEEATRHVATCDALWYSNEVWVHGIQWLRVRNFSIDSPRVGKSHTENIASVARPFGAAEDNEHGIGHSWFSREWDRCMSWRRLVVTFSSKAVEPRTACYNSRGCNKWMIKLVPAWSVVVGDYMQTVIKNLSFNAHSRFVSGEVRARTWSVMMHPRAEQTLNSGEISKDVKTGHDAQLVANSI